MFEWLGWPWVALGCPRAILISSEPRARSQVGRARSWQH